jgi:short-subunit dehydrogenase
MFRRSIWTSFLPEKIERARFNLALCNIKKRHDVLTVDTHLTDTLHLTRQNAASFTAEIGIFDAQGNMEIQVEGLTVGSFTSTKSEDDFELYLTTVTDVDPDDEIISASPSEIHAPSPMLLESCERVASYFLSGNSIEPERSAFREIFSAFPSPAIRPLAHRRPWPRETEASLVEFILRSPYHSTLNSLYQLGQNLSDILAGMLPTIVEEAHQLLGFQRHISRIVGQISHKYARMNVLGLTDPRMGLVEHLLTGLKDSFLTLRIGAGAEKNMAHRGLATDALRKRIQIDPLDLSSQHFENASKMQYDLVVLSTSLLNNLDATATLFKIKEVMRPGGFLLLVHSSHLSLQARIRQYAETPNTRATAFEQSRWADTLDNSGFTQTATGADQHYPPGFSIMVRQSESREKQMLLNPMGHLGTPESYLTDKLLIIGGGLIASGVSQLLKPRCHSIQTLEVIEDVDATSLSTCSAVILLKDIDEPVLATMTEARMKAFRALFRPEMIILWVTLNARFRNPDHAASLGFTRTMSAETPGLTLQVLDLDTLESLPAVDVVSETFARLAVRPLVGDSRETPLWINEQEIHFEKCTRLVPRVVPWAEGIERVNSSRRVVSKIVNTLEKQVQIVRLEHSKGKAEYVTTVQPLPFDGSSRQGRPTIKVDYSLAEALVWGPALAGYVCMGRNTATYQTQIALSTSNGSYISVPPDFVRDIPEAFAQGEFMKHVVGYLAFFTMVMIADTKTSAEDKTILLVEPEVILQECVKVILDENLADIKICFTDKERCEQMAGAIYLHPRASVRESKTVLNPKGTFVFNFLPNSHNISKALAGNLPQNCEYRSSTQLLILPPHVAAETSTQEMVKEVWDLAVSLAIAKTTPKPVATVSSVILTVPELLGKVDKASPFQILDWRAERTISHIVQPLVATNLLKSNKTYVLVGITRDLGQSLCTLFVSQGARHIVLASRNPPKTRPVWQQEMIHMGVDVRFEVLDVTDSDHVMTFQTRLAATCPPVGGIVNGAMVLDDRVFSEMSLETFQRVMRPKTIGSKNLDDAFHDPDMDFFIMTSSFAAIGGHAGQSNYAAANMYMNGLAAWRRHRGLAGSALNIGVIYGLGFLHREKDALYEGLAREGYPPISERDLHHMFVEAIAAGKPKPGQILDITTGLSRFPAKRPTIPWQSDPRFSHFTHEDDEDEVVAGEGEKTLKELLGSAHSQSELLEVVSSAFTSYLEKLLHLQEGTVARDNSFGELGVDSLAAVDVRSWIWKSLAQDVAVMKIIGATSITNCTLFAALSLE